MLKIPYALEADKPPSVPVITKSLAEKLEALLLGVSPAHITGGTAGQLIVVQNTGAGAFKAMKGDATIAEDGTLTIGSEAVGTSKLANNAVTTAKIAASNITEALLATGAVGSSKLKPTVGHVRAPLTLTAGVGGIWGEQQVCKLDLKPAPTVNSYLIVQAVWWFLLEGKTGTYVGAKGGFELVGGEPSPENLSDIVEVKVPIGATPAQLSVAQTYVIPLSPGFSYTLRMGIRKIEDGGGTGVVKGLGSAGEGPACGFNYMVVAR